MKSRRGDILILLLLLAAAFSLATVLQPRLAAGGGAGDSDNVLKVLFGDGRRLFANHFFVKADVSFHSGYYPSIFDQAQAPKTSRHMTSEEGSPAEEEHERKMNFLGPPKDWIERFGRHFMITEHTHLASGNEREILPWLKLSADLDPQRVDTYTVAAYWLRVRLGKVTEPSNSCAKDCAITRTTRKFSLSWAASISRTTNSPPGPVTCGNSPCAAGGNRRRPSSSRTPSCWRKSAPISRNWKSRPATSSGPSPISKSRNRSPPIQPPCSAKSTPSSQSFPSRLRPTVPHGHSNQGPAH